MCHLLIIWNLLRRVMLLAILWWIRDRDMRVCLLLLEQSHLKKSILSCRVSGCWETDITNMWLALHRFVTSTIACPDLCLWCFDSRNRCGRSISAFGGSDGGKSIWENALRLSIERFQGQKPHLTTLETPLLSRPGASAPDQAIKQSNVKNKRKKRPWDWAYIPGDNYWLGCTLLTKQFAYVPCVYSKACEILTEWKQ